MIMSLEGRQAVSRAQWGKVLSPEHIAAIRAANTGRKQSPEHIAKRAAARIENTRKRKALLPPKVRKPYKKKVLTQEHKDRIAAANTGKRHSDETREKLRQINLGKTIPPEVRIKIGNASRGKPRPQWVRDKISAGRLGKVLTPEHRLDISEAHKGRKQSPEAIANPPLWANRDPSLPISSAAKVTGPWSRGMPVHWSRPSDIVDG
jgi:hypothetical protein